MLSKTVFRSMASLACSILTGCGGTYSVLESGRLAAALPSSSTRIPPATDSTWLQLEAALQTVAPYHMTIFVKTKDTIPAPVATVLDPLVGSTTATVFASQGTARFWVGFDVVHELKSYRLGFGHSFTDPTASYRAELDAEFGQTTLIQDSHWDNLDYGSLGRTYLDRPYHTESNSKALEWFAKLGGTVSAIHQGPIVNFEVGSFPIATSNLTSSTTETIPALSMAVGWILHLAQGRCATLFRYTAFNDKHLFGLEAKWVTEFAKPGYLRPKPKTILDFPTVSPMATPKAWPESREAIDSSAIIR